MASMKAECVIRFEPAGVVAAMADLIKATRDVMELLPEWFEPERRELQQRIAAGVAALDESIKEARDVATGGSGDFDRRVEFQQRADTPGVIGSTPVWTPYCFRWAAGDDGNAGGGESQVAGQVLALETRQWRIRWDSEAAKITPKMRMVYQGRVFEIVSVLNRGEKRVAIELTVKEATA